MGAMLPPMPRLIGAKPQTPFWLVMGKAAFKAVFLVLVLVTMGAMLPPIPPSKLGLRPKPLTISIVI